MSPPPITAQQIDAIDGVMFHFQSDGDFNPLYHTNPEAQNMAGITPICLNFASRIAGASGSGSVNQLVAYSENSKFVLFCINVPDGTSVKPRAFGVKTEISKDVPTLIEAIKQIVNA